jgi:hypothetical protein
MEDLAMDRSPTRTPLPAGRHQDDAGFIPMPPATWAAPGASWPMGATAPADDAAPDSGAAADARAAAEEDREPGPTDPFNEDGHPPAELMRDLVGPPADAAPAPDRDVHLTEVDGPDADLEPGNEDPNLTR